MWLDGLSTLPGPAIAAKAVTLALDVPFDVGVVVAAAVVMATAAQEVAAASTLVLVVLTPVMILLLLILARLLGQPGPRQAHQGNKVHPGDLVSGLDLPQVQLEVTTLASETTITTIVGVSIMAEASGAVEEAPRPQPHRLDPLGAITRALALEVPVADKGQEDSLGFTWRYYVHQWQE